MERIVLTIVAALVLPLCARAQFGDMEKEQALEGDYPTWEWKSTDDFGLSYGFGQHGQSVVSAVMNTSLEFVRRLSVVLSYEPAQALFDKTDYRSTSEYAWDVLGGGVGFRLFENKTSRFPGRGTSLDIRATVTTTLGACDLKFTCYRAGLYFYNATTGLPKKKGGSSPTLYAGAGMCRYDFHSLGLRDTFNPFLEIGVRL